jgi:hypothetical protein
MWTVVLILKDAAVGLLVTSVLVHLPLISSMEKNLPRPLSSECVPVDAPMSGVENCASLIPEVMGSDDDTEVELPEAEFERKPTKTPIKGASLLDVINTYRTEMGKSLIKTNQVLCGVAETRLEDIKANFGHEKFNDRVSGISFEQIGENLWQGTSGDNQTVVESWKQSPGHQANLVGEWSNGCGVSSGGFVVFMFMR